MYAGLHRLLLPGAQRFRSETAANLYSANTFTLYDLSSAFTTQATYCTQQTGIIDTGDPANLACTADLYQLHPNLLSPRNLFRLPDSGPSMPR
jgi:hypothetical protein